MLASGVPVEIVQMILGHSSPAVTRQVYAHLMRKATTAQVDAALATVAERAREQSVSNEALSTGSAGPAARTYDRQIRRLLLYPLSYRGRTAYTARGRF
jgi:hypothetical protein